MKGNGVKWLLVGLGALSEKRVAAAIASSDQGKLIGVCDLVEERVRRFAEEYQVEESFTDISTALESTSADSVYLATPVFLHRKQAVQVIQSGRHVLVEKPLGLTAEDAREVVKAAEHTDIRAGCAYYRRFFPCYRQAKEMIDRGEFGKIVLVRMTYFSWTNPSPDDPHTYWRVVKSKSGGGPISDMGSHMFDVMIGLLGMPNRVFARTKTLVHPYDVEDSAVVTMELEQGADVIASFHWNSKTWSHEFEIIGTDAKVKWHPYDSGKVLKTVGRDIQELDLPNPENLHRPVVDNFNQAVLLRQEPAVTLKEALKTNILIDAVYQSSRAERELKISRSNL